jgi:hypothetical protein
MILQIFKMGPQSEVLFQTGTFEGQWSPNQEKTIGLSTSHHASSNEVGESEGLGKWLIVLQNLAVSKKRLTNSPF